MAAKKNAGAENAPHYKEDGYKSRSQKKRESTALQRHGEELAALSPAVQKQLPLTPDLEQALAEWRGLKTWEAKRRHLQYIGRLMRELDEPETLLCALEAHVKQTRGAAGSLHRVEALRDNLLRQDESARQEALEQALNAHPVLERDRLAHLVGAALAERGKKRPPRKGRELFRYLRDTLESKE